MSVLLSQIMNLLTGVIVPQLQSIHASQAEQRLETDRLNRNIEHHNACYPSQPPLGMSIGVIRCDPHSANTLEDMIHQADAAMYIEKRRKRDRRETVRE